MVEEDRAFLESTQPPASAESADVERAAVTAAMSAAAAARVDRPQPASVDHPRPASVERRTEEVPPPPIASKSAKPKKIQRDRPAPERAVPERRAAAPAPEQIVEVRRAEPVQPERRKFFDRLFEKHGHDEDD